MSPHTAYDPNPRRSGVLVNFYIRYPDLNQQIHSLKSHCEQLLQLSDLSNRASLTSGLTKPRVGAISCSSCIMKVRSRAPHMSLSTVNAARRTFTIYLCMIWIMESRDSRSSALKWIKEDCHDDWREYQRVLGGKKVKGGRTDFQTNENKHKRVSKLRSRSSRDSKVLPKRTGISRLTNKSSA